MAKNDTRAPRSWLARLGPGLITGAADDDPSGVATYAQAGAALGYGLLWTLMLARPLMFAVQLVAGRIGRVTGAGVVANARRHLPRWAAAALVLLLLGANVANIAADLAAMGEAAALLIGGSGKMGGGAMGFAAVFGVAGLLAQVLVPYRRYAAFLRWSTLALFTYIAAAFTVPVDWTKALAGALWPAAPLSVEALSMIVAVLGTTISPYLFVWQAAEEIEEMQLDRREPLSMRPEAGAEIDWLRFDTGVGVGLSNLVAFFIMLTAAATLNAGGVTRIDTAAQAAEALRPLAGDAAFLLFSLGIIGAGLLAIPVLAGSAAYAVSDFRGGDFSLEKPFRRAPGAYANVIAATLCGAGLDFAGASPMKLLFASAVVNGLIAPPFLFAMMFIVGNDVAMAPHVAPRWLKALGWTATAAMTLAVAMLGFSLFQ